MTISQLISANGARTPRYITIGGRTVFGSVTATATGLVHKTFGAVTPVANHTFHGGDDPVDTGNEPWWNDQDLVAPHIVAMKTSFPGFTYLPGEPDMPPTWAGDIDTGRGRFKIVVILRHDQGLPFVKLLSKQRLGTNLRGRFIPSPHLFTSGALCIADESDWNAGEHTAATATAWAAHWLAAYVEWRINHHWPVRGVSVAA